MSKIAVFVETYTPSMGADSRQVMLVPFGETVRVYTRLADGGKGPGNRWVESDINSVLESIDLIAGEEVTKDPVGVRMTDKDLTALEEKGYALVLHVKAVNAHAKSPDRSKLFYEDEQVTMNPVEEISQLHSRVERQDDLEDLVIDLRSKTAPFMTSSDASPTQTIDAEEESLEPVFQLAKIPPMERAKQYVNRQVGGLEDFTIYDLARQHKVDVLIYGPTGPGKTSSVVAWAAARKLRLATVSGNAALEPSQLIGKYIPDGHGGFMWIDGPVTDVVRNGGVLLMDEVNFISPKIYTVLYSLLDARRALILLDHKGETIEAHPDLTIFATMNPSYVGTTPLNFAFRNRFAIQIPWDYDDNVEAKLVKAQSILTVARQLRSEAAKGEFETPISTNMLMELEQFIGIFGYEFAINNFIAHFDEEEQDKVRLVMNTHEYNIQEEFNFVDKFQESSEDNIGIAEKLGTEAENWLSSNPNPTI